MSAQLIIGIAIAAGLVGAIGWLIYRFGIQHRGATIAPRSRRHFAVIDAAVVDERRRLILIRRDNTEHLMLIGGPNDLLIEANIPAAATVPRQAKAPHSSTSGDTLPPAEMADESSTLWPQPEAARAEPLRPQPTPRVPEHMLRPEPLQQRPAARVREPMFGPPRPQPPPRVPEQTLRPEPPHPQPRPRATEYLLRPERTQPQATRLPEQMLRPEPPMQPQQGPPPLPSPRAQRMARVDDPLDPPADASSNGTGNDQK